MPAVSSTITDEQLAARELVSSWASGSGAIKAVRDVEQGDVDAWRVPYDRLAQLGIFGVAVPEELGGAGGTVEDLCAMLDEAAAALVPGPVATTALATLVLTDETLLDGLASGERTAGIALSSSITLEGGTASGTAELVLGGLADGLLLLPVRGQERGDSGSDGGTQWVVVDAAADGVTVEPLTATDFSRPLARVELASAPVTALAVGAERMVDLTATVLAAEASGLARWLLDTAVDYAKVREQFGKPIGSFQAVKHMCAEMLLRSQQIAVAAADAAGAVADPQEAQLSIAVAVASAIGIEAEKVNARDCIQVLGGIGITWEHDAHLYLRRAYGISQLLGGRPPVGLDEPGHDVGAPPPPASALAEHGVGLPDARGRAEVDAERAGCFDLAALENGAVALASSDAHFGGMNNLLLPGRAENMGSGWETRRRRGPGSDWILIRLAARGTVRVLEVDTNHFKGNYPDTCSIEGCAASGAGAAELMNPAAPWREILPRTKLKADTRHFFERELAPLRDCTHLRLNIYPDGGVSRLRVWGSPASAPGVAASAVSSDPLRKADSTPPA